MVRMLQAALKTVFPDQCMLCGQFTANANGLCPGCWRDTPFLLSRGCGACGAPLLGSEGGAGEQCEDCRATPRPWRRGSAVMLYEGSARNLILGVKHGDRLDLLPRLAAWMLPKARVLLSQVEGEIVVLPMPIHWRRLLKRRHNQAAGLARPLAKGLGLPYLPDALQRVRPTVAQKQMDPQARFDQQEGSIKAHPRWRGRLAGRSVLLVDDVMTSGASLTAASQACLAGGAEQVFVIVLARAVKSP
ncbi:MAG: ComF family protein [Mangrovicoccus sp.]|nr:ComF family protein [Mangrovicoccus sp.]